MPYKLTITIITSLLFLLIACNSSQTEYTLSDQVPPIDQKREAKVLSAFFGLDNALPRTAIGISPKAPGKDGMPVVFSHELDPTTLEASDFKIKTSKGAFYNVDVASFRPAMEAFELRTVLLIGDYGNHPDNEPIEVEIIGDLLARSGQNFKGQKIAVTPLEKGPFVSYAEYFTLDNAYPYVASGRACDCPKDQTAFVVRTVWAGGVRALDGNELGVNELTNFTIDIQTSNKDTLQIHPFQIADLNDNDNNIDLCIKEKGIPFRVSVKANTAIDPRDDANDLTSVGIVSRW